MEFSNILSIIALSISVISVGTSLFFKFRELRKIKAVSSFLEPTPSEYDPDSKPVLRIEVINMSDDDILLDYFYVGYEGRKGLSIVDTLWDTDDGERFLLKKGDHLEHNFIPDHAGILIDEDKNRANRMFVYTRMKTRHRVRGDRKNLKAYLKAAEHF